MVNVQAMPGGVIGTIERLPWAAQGVLGCSAWPRSVGRGICDLASQSRVSWVCLSLCSELWGSRTQRCDCFLCYAFLIEHKYSE